MKVVRSRSGEVRRAPTPALKESANGTAYSTGFSSYMTQHIACPRLLLDADGHRRRPCHFNDAPSRRVDCPGGIDTRHRRPVTQLNGVRTELRRPTPTHYGRTI